jgi:hypothetical protein
MNNETKELILSVIKGEVDSVKLPMIPIDDVITLLQEKSYIDKDDSGDYDSNGWQVDFWLQFHINESIYTLSGSLWYGQYKFFKEDD